jgi:hypothetical protein
LGPVTTSEYTISAEVHCTNWALRSCQEGLGLDADAKRLHRLRVGSLPTIRKERLSGRSLLSNALPSSLFKKSLPPVSCSNKHHISTVIEYPFCLVLMADFVSQFTFSRHLRITSSRNVPKSIKFVNAVTQPSRQHQNTIKEKPHIRNSPVGSRHSKSIQISTSHGTVEFKRCWEAARDNCYSTTAGHPAPCP